MQIAINTEYRYNKERDNNKLSFDWEIVDYDYTQLLNHQMEGYPITNIYTDGYDGFRRKKEHFASASFIALDFDNNPNELINYKAIEFTVKELNAGQTERAKFIKDNGYIGYLTYNHSNENNRFRILFKLPKPITDIEEYIKTYKAFLEKFPSADHNYVISTGFVWGAKKNTSPLKLCNTLSEETLNEVLQSAQKLSNCKTIKSNNKILIVDKTLSGKQVEFEINKYLIEFKQAKVGNRMNTLNKACYSIGGLIANHQISETSEEEIKEKISSIAYELGSLTNFDSFTKNEIDTTIKRSLEEGKNKPFNPEQINGSRIFANKKKDGYFQIPQPIANNYPSTEEINEIAHQQCSDMGNAQIVNFIKFSIHSDAILSEELITDIFDVLRNAEAMKYYLALWIYANNKNSLSFKEIEINEIIRIVHPNISKQAIYRHRIKFKDYIRKLYTVTLFVKTKSYNEEIEEGVRLIDKLVFIEKRNRRLMTLKLPETFKKFGSYIPYEIMKLSGNEKGAINLVIALSKEAFRKNGFERLKKKDFRPPENLLPVIWSQKKLLIEIGTIKTNNITEKNRLTYKTLTRLKEICIIDRFQLHDNKVTICLKK